MNRRRERQRRRRCNRARGRQGCLGFRARARSAHGISKIPRTVILSRVPRRRITRGKRGTRGLASVNPRGSLQTLAFYSLRARARARVTSKPLLIVGVESPASRNVKTANNPTILNIQHVRSLRFFFSVYRSTTNAGLVSHSSQRATSGISGRLGIESFQVIAS